MSKRKKILLIEDDPTQVMMYKTQFELDGFMVFFAYQYEDALKIIKKEKPDIILLDLILGQEKGEDILKKLKKEKITDKIPVIIFSNLKTDKDEQKFKKMGAFDYWPKTKFLPKDLSQEIEKIININ